MSTVKTIQYAGKFLNFVQNGRWEYVERANASGVVAIIATTKTLLASHLLGMC